MRNVTSSFGENQNFIKATKNQTEKMNVPLDEKEFLREIGIPQKTKPRIRAAPPENFLRTLPNLLPEIDFPIAYSAYRVIAEDESTFICLDENRQGAVFAVDPYQEMAPRYINSSASSFVEFLALYKEIPSSEEAEKMSKSDLKSSTNLVKSKMIEADSTAFKDPNYWWSIIFEELFLFTR